MNRCEYCGGPMRPLMISWFCPNDCDIKAKASAAVVSTGSAWDRVQRKMPILQARALEIKARLLEKYESWHVLLLDDVNWDVVFRMTNDQRQAAFAIIHIYRGEPTLSKCRGAARTFEELPDQWTP